MTRQADPAIVAAWVAGWAISRATPPPAPVLGGHLITVGLPQHKARYVFPGANLDVLSRLARRVRERWVFIKVCAEAEDLASAWPEGWRLHDPGFMMTTSLEAASAPPPLPDGYSLSLEPGEVTLAQIRDRTGALAASGRIAVAQGHVIFDQILTVDDHRRCGLGRVVMAALSQAAIDRGVAHAVLVATLEGRRLYEAVGWRLHSPFTTVVIEAES